MASILFKFAGGVGARQVGLKVSVQTNYAPTCLALLLERICRIYFYLHTCHLRLDRLMYKNQGSKGGPYSTVNLDVEQPASSITLPLIF